MKALLLALNAKYIHTSLALRSIKAFCKDYEKNIHILEMSINHNENDILKCIYQEKPDIIGISCYIWNMRYVKTLIPILKKILPQATIVLGGPEVSYEGEQILLEYDADIIMQGEGEETWKEYLDYRNGLISHLNEIAGLIYRDADGTIQCNKPRKPLDLRKLPFVYQHLEDLTHKIIYYEASRGCPFNCQYCLSSIEQDVRFVPVDTVKQHMDFFLANKVKQVKFVDRTFNTKKQFAMSIWKHLIEHDNGFTNFHFEIAAELITEDMYDLLAQARPGLIQFEIGVQSTNPTVLKTIKRPMPFEEIKEVVLRIKSLKNIHQHLDLIAGLPGEDYDSFRKSFNDVMSIRPEQFQLGFLKLLKGSGLRENASQFGLIYKSEPPYEILYTSHISYDEILRLHTIDDLVDRYYNNGRFSHALEYLFCYFNTPFDCFEKLSIFWEAQGYHQMEHNKMAHYTHLIAFGKAQDALNMELLKEALRLDYILNETIHEVPFILETINRESIKNDFNALLKNDIWVQEYLPHLINLPPRQRYRKVHLDVFHYPIWDGTHPEQSTTLKPLTHPQKILFDYTTMPPKLLLIHEE